MEAEVSRLKADLQKTDTDHEVTIKAIQAEVTTLQNRLSTAQKVFTLKLGQHQTVKPGQPMALH